MLRTPPIALLMNGQRGMRVAEKLHSARFDIACVVIPAQAPEATPLREALKSITPHVHLMERGDSGWDSVCRFVASHTASLGVVAGFSLLLPESLLSIPKWGFLNLHAGPVPGYRGGSPLNWQLINGEENAGISILRMTAGLDDGPVVARQTLAIGAGCTIAELHSRADEAFASLLLDVLADVEDSLAKATEQDHSGACYWHQRCDEDGYFNPTTIGTEDLDRLVRALGRPYPGAWAYLGTGRMRVFAVRRSEMRYRGTPGRIVRLGREAPVLVLRDGALALEDYELTESAGGLRNGMRLR